jgi:FKBP-type peptidyl-prolyl cis-trans isomerase SlyD
LQITKDCVVTFSYKLSTLQGEVIEEASLGHPAAYLHGGYDGIFPKVEIAMDGKEIGDQVDVALEPEDAFGEYDAEMVRVEPAHLFPEDVQVGMQFEGTTEDGSHHLVYTVTDVAEEKVVLDGNHPLAGQGVRVQCRVEDVREATREEIAHGHSHAGGEHEDH